MHLVDEFEELEKDRERLRQQPRPGRARFMAMDDAGGAWTMRRSRRLRQGQAQPEQGHIFQIQAGYAEFVVKRGIARLHAATRRWISEGSVGASKCELLAAASLETSSGTHHPGRAAAATRGPQASVFRTKAAR
ncbi:hypothetical protein AWZ03_015491 [Drosophila navojoa]|uniref:Uncharacterized protein n=1 Tax=Drosophila navojoa TaxID=7232 RepID=A0A484AKP0_DRONA|nr:hypothetical protein AWZ03_015491 [Drosophila navojoa]